VLSLLLAKRQFRSALVVAAVSIELTSHVVSDVINSSIVDDVRQLFTQLHA
jgi:hypothetical protein